MSIAGHVSRAMLSRYTHVRMEAKRRALDEIAARQRVRDCSRSVLTVASETRRQRKRFKIKQFGRFISTYPVQSVHAPLSS
jgi:hypothetical protein